LSNVTRIIKRGKRNIKRNSRRRKRGRGVMRRKLDLSILQVSSIRARNSRQKCLPSMKAEKKKIKQPRSRRAKGFPGIVHREHELMRGKSN